MRHAQKTRLRDTHARHPLPTATTPRQALLVSVGLMRWLSPRLLPSSLQGSGIHRDLSGRGGPKGKKKKRGKLKFSEARGAQRGGGGGAGAGELREGLKGGGTVCVCVCVCVCGGGTSPAA